MFAETEVSASSESLVVVFRILLSIVSEDLEAETAMLTGLEVCILQALSVYIFLALLVCQFQALSAVQPLSICQFPALSAVQSLSICQFQALPMLQALSEFQALMSQFAILFLLAI